MPGRDEGKMPGSIDPIACTMNLPLSPESATQAVVWGGLAIGLAFGAAGQASRFCIRGAIADWYLFGSKGRMLSWVLALVVALVGTQALLAGQVFEGERTVMWSSTLRWVSSLVGGLVFGYGMVLAAGCPHRSLVKAGTGNLRAIVTLLVAALGAQMTLRGLFAEARSKTVDTVNVQLAGPQDLGSVLAGWTGLGVGALRWVLVLAIVVAAVAWLWRQRSQLTTAQWIGSAAIGLLVPIAWWLTGHVGYQPEHPETLEAAWMGTAARRPEALSFTAPLANAADLLTYWTDKNTVVTFGVTMALGVLIGSFVSAWLRGEAKLESFANAAELRDHLIGGLLMGFGGVTALGCSVGNGVTGLAMLSIGAALAVAGIVGGALLALRSQARRAGRAAPELAAV